MGPAIMGSPDVMVNGRPALRKGDMGMHAACCGPNMWTATAGSSGVNINGKPAHRNGDAQNHCGGSGKLNMGSADVIVGDGGGGGGGGGGNSGSGGASGSSGQAGQGSQSGTYNSNSSSGSGSSGSQSSQQQQQQQQSQNNAAPGQQQPQKQTAQWKAVWSDDQSSVSGIKSHFEGPDGAKDLSGGSNSVPGLNQGSTYSVTLVGDTTVQGKVTDQDGNPVPNAKVHVDRAFGESVDLVTDSNGVWKLEGLAKDEPYDAHVVEVKVKAEGTLVDENQSPMAGVRGILRGDGGTIRHFISDAQGKYSIEGLVPGETYHVEILDLPPKRR